MIRFLSVMVLCLGWTAAGTAQDKAPADLLFDALGFPRIVSIMRDEGMVYGASIEEELFQRGGGPQWAAMVADAYDLDHLMGMVRKGLARDLAGKDIAPMIAFFTSDLGVKVVSLEISARQVMMADGMEQASNEAYLKLKAANDPRIALLDDFVTASDLVESNVVGAMNANYAFYTGLAGGGAFPNVLTQDQILSDVWSEEDAIRKETTLWVYSYLALAYQPLSDAEMAEYTAFSETGAGRALNAAIFNSFDEMFVDVSRSLGLGAAQFLASDEL